MTNQLPHVAPIRTTGDFGQAGDPPRTISLTLKLACAGNKQVDVGVASSNISVSGARAVIEAFFRSWRHASPQNVGKPTKIGGGVLLRGRPTNHPGPRRRRRHAAQRHRHQPGAHHNWPSRSARRRPPVHLRRRQLSISRSKCHPRVVPGFLGVPGEQTNSSTSVEPGLAVFRTPAPPSDHGRARRDLHHSTNPTIGLGLGTSACVRSSMSCRSLSDGNP